MTPLDDALAPFVRRVIGEVLAEVGRLDERSDLDRLLVTPEQAGEVLGCSRDSVLRLVAAGELRAVQGPWRGNRLVVEDLRAWVVRQAAEQAGSGR